VLATFQGVNLPHVPRVYRTGHYRQKAFPPSQQVQLGSAHWGPLRPMTSACLLGWVGARQYLHKAVSIESNHLQLWASICNSCLTTILPITWRNKWHYLCFCRGRSGGLEELNGLLSHTANTCQSRDFSQLTLTPTPPTQPPSLPSYTPLLLPLAFLCSSSTESLSTRQTRTEFTSHCDFWRCKSFHLSC
jgi:hypothetical protein